MRVSGVSASNVSGLEEELESELLRKRREGVAESTLLLASGAFYKIKEVALEVGTEGCSVSLSDSALSVTMVLSRDRLVLLKYFVSGELAGEALVSFFVGREPLAFYALGLDDCMEGLKKYAGIDSGDVREDG